MHITILATAFVPEGIIMASDGRSTYEIPLDNGNVLRKIASDNTRKIFTFNEFNVGISCCGLLKINNIQIFDFINTFTQNKLNTNDDVITITRKFNDYIKSFNIHSKVTYHICGYKDHVPYVFDIQHGVITRRNIDNYSNIYYGCIVSGSYDGVKDMLINDIFNRNFSKLDIIGASEILLKIISNQIINQNLMSHYADCGGEPNLLLVTDNNIKFLL